MCWSRQRPLNGPCFFSATRIEFAREMRKDINRAELIYERKILSRSKQHSRPFFANVTLRRSLRGASISNCIQFLWNSLLGQVPRWWHRALISFVHLFSPFARRNLLSVVFHLIPLSRFVPCAPRIREFFPCLRTFLLFWHLFDIYLPRYF